MTGRYGLFRGLFRVIKIVLWVIFVLSRVLGRSRERAGERNIESSEVFIKGWFWFDFFCSVLFYFIFWYWDFFKDRDTEVIVGKMSGCYFWRLCRVRFLDFI